MHEDDCFKQLIQGFYALPELHIDSIVIFVEEVTMTLIKGQQCKPVNRLYCFVSSEWLTIANTSYGAQTCENTELGFPVKWSKAPVVLLPYHVWETHSPENKGGQCL